MNMLIRFFITEKTNAPSSTQMHLRCTKLGFTFRDKI